MLANATRLCGANFGVLFRYDGNVFQAAAMREVAPAFAEHLRHNPPRPHPRSAIGRLLQTKQPIHIADITAEPAYAEGEPSRVALVEIGGARTYFIVPMLKDDELIGAIAIYRREVRPFTDQQVQLVASFASQAVIAIENVRLLNELRESLQQQTATADVLKVISRSAFDLQAVLDTLAASAARLCNADQVAIHRREGDVYPWSAISGLSGDTVALLKKYMSTQPLLPGGASVVGRAVLECRPVQIPELCADPEYTLTEAQRIAGHRTAMGVPLLREGVPIGAMALLRTRVTAFNDKEVELAQTFADQAVIAIENTRLFEEVQARTRELTESLQQQTATADVLKVISRSAFDLKVVLNTLVESAARLCEADMAGIMRPNGAAFEYLANFGFSPEYDAFLEAHLVPAGPGSLAGRTLLEAKAIQISDVLSDPEYTLREMAKIGGQRTMLGVPLLREGTPIGVIILQRKTVHLFTDKQIELLTTFADQAVIAIENTRLFEEVQTRTKELQDSLDRQTATSEVLGVISRSPNEVQPVLDTIVATAHRLCQAERTVIWRLEGETFRAVAHRGLPEERVESLLSARRPVSRGNLVGRATLARRAVQVEDVATDPELVAAAHAYLRAGNVHTVLAVPLLLKGHPIGVITLARTRVAPFDDKQVALIESFADQAVIAIENSRLFEAEQASKRELTESLEQQTATADVLKVISRSAL